MRRLAPPGGWPAARGSACRGIVWLALAILIAPPGVEAHDFKEHQEFSDFWDKKVDYTCSDPDTGDTLYMDDEYRNDALSDAGTKGDCEALDDKYNCSWQSIPFDIFVAFRASQGLAAVSEFHRGDAQSIFPHKIKEYNEENMISDLGKAMPGSYAPGPPGYGDATGLGRSAYTSEPVGMAFMWYNFHKPRMTFTADEWEKIQWQLQEEYGLSKSYCLKNGAVAAMQAQGFTPQMVPYHQLRCGLLGGEGDGSVCTAAGCKWITPSDRFANVAEACASEVTEEECGADYSYYYYNFDREEIDCAWNGIACLPRWETIGDTTGLCLADEHIGLNEYQSLVYKWKISTVAPCPVACGLTQSIRPDDIVCMAFNVSTGNWTTGHDESHCTEKSLTDRPEHVCEATAACGDVCAAACGSGTEFDGEKCVANVKPCAGSSGAIIFMKPEAVFQNPGLQAKYCVLIKELGGSCD